jgi:PhzF family phenazine biosynthesis protein
MPLCLHGTIAAAFVLFKNITSKNLTCITKDKIDISARQEKDIIQIRVSKSLSPTINPDKIQIAQMLNLNCIDDIENELSFTVSSVGSPKLLVPIASFESLAALKPNFNLITQWSLDNKINGLYVYTKDSQNNSFDFYARGFNPKTGHNEDAATGVAAALALSLKRSITVGQGVFMERPSEIRVSYYDPENIWVGGRSVLVSKH